MANAAEHMKKLILPAITFVCCALLHGQTIREERRPGAFFFALGENMLSNTLVYLADRYVAGASWARVTPDSIQENLAGPWVWDRDEYFTNQFGHPYQGSTYHTAARSNGFNFYQAVLFDAFGSLSWELFCETNAPSINDFVSTTLGGAAFGEMFHRLYLEISHPLAALVSPVDAINETVTRRRAQRTTNIYSLKLASGIGYTYAEQAIEKDGEMFNLNKRHMVSTDLSCTVVYGDPFVQRSLTPYDHFELALYANFGIPFWYNLKLLSDAYLFSFSPRGRGSGQASTGLSLHCDFFADRQIDFFCQALDWTYKYKREFRGNTEIEFKVHTGWTVFSADTFYINNGYSNLRSTDNNYGTGTNIKFIFAVQHPRRGALELKTFIYHVFNVFQNENVDTGSDFCTFFTADYSFPVSEHTVIGAAVSTLRHDTQYDHLPDMRKRTNDVKVYIAWKK
jgi:hypothetical protein